MKLFARLFLALALLWTPARADLLNTGVGNGYSTLSCSQATTFLARTSGLDAAHTAAYTNLICGLVANGLWSGFDFLYVFSTQDATTAGLNLVSTSYTATPTSSPTFTADRGYAGNGTSSYVSSNWNPSTNGVQLTQDSASIGVWSLTDKVSATSTEIGAVAAGATSFLRMQTKNAGNFTSAINNTTSVNVANTDATGFYTGNRSSSTAVTAYKNGVSVGSGSIASTPRPNATMLIDAQTVEGTGPSNFSVSQLSIAFAGRSFSAVEQAQLYQVFCGWQKAVGAATC